MSDNKIEEAKKLIEEQNKKEIESCQKELNAVLEKYKCRMEIQPNIVINGQNQQISLIKL